MGPTAFIFKANEHNLMGEGVITEGVIYCMYLMSDSLSGKERPYRILYFPSFLLLWSPISDNMTSQRRHKSLSEMCALTFRTPLSYTCNYPFLEFVSWTCAAAWLSQPSHPDAATVVFFNNLLHLTAPASLFPSSQLCSLWNDRMRRRSGPPVSVRTTYGTVRLISQQKICGCGEQWRSN